MEVSQLRYFLAVAESGSFSRAAEACQVAQPSLSQQIQKLERELRQPLFDRLPRGAALTEAGARFLPRARTIISGFDDARREIQDAGAENAEPAGTLRIGAIPTIAPYLMPKTVQRFLKKHPQVDLHLDEDVTARLIEKLNSGQLDLVLAALPLEGEHIQAQALFKEELVLALPAKHVLARGKTVKWAALETAPFLKLHEMHCLSQQIEGICQRKGVETRVAFEGSQLGTVLRMVATGIGVSMVPRMAVSHEVPGVVFRAMEGVPPTRTVGAAWHLLRYRSRALKAFMELMKTEK